MSKLVIIGAGSAVFTQGLVMDLIAAGEGQNWELGLVDTNPDVLDAITRLARKMIRGRGAKIALTSSTNRWDVLPGADYVVTTIGVGGRRAWEQDVFIPRKHGIYQPVGDTVMAGGISRAMRMIPAVVDIARDIAAICPQALFFNYANPMAANCLAIRRATGVAVTGLCHGVPDSVRMLADWMGVPREQIKTKTAGINHLSFVYQLSHGGDDLLPRLREKITERRTRGIDPARIGALAFRDGGEEVNPFSWSVFEVLNAYPVPGDRHITEFYADVFPGGDYYGKRFGIDAFSFEEVIEAGDQKYAETEELARSDDPLPESFFGRFGGEHEQLIDIIQSIRKGVEEEYSVNLPNGAGFRNLDAESVIEQPAVTTPGGFRTVGGNDFPNPLASVVNRHLEIIDLTVQAALEGDSALMADAILAGGYLTDRDRVEAMVDELLAAHREHLPQFG